MEDLIKQAFAHVDVIGPHVQEGHYDLMGPDGEIILPIIWDKTIQPGWQVTMRMWPMEKHPLQRQGAQPGMPDPRTMTPEDRQRFLQQMHMRQAHAGHHGHAGRAMPMRPPAGMVPPGGVPPQPPPPGIPGFPQFRPAGAGGSRMPPDVHVMDVRPEKKKGDGKAAKKTISFFAGGKKPAKKSSKKYVQAWY